MLLCTCWPLLLGPTPAARAAEPYFAIHVVDEATGRGVPLVELRTVNDLRYVTDSNGFVAFPEPGLMGHRVFFHVFSHGYEFPQDGFGYRGHALDVTPGGSAELRIKRLNIAERLYRVTGEGIYADSVLLGRSVPMREPILNAQVLGSDSVENVVYHGRIYWFWGDTNRPGYPLGNFHVPGARSLLPGEGGLDPSLGVDLEYFLDDKGFAKETCHMPGDGPTWIGGLVVLEAAGRERMFATYVKIRNMLEAYERGLVEFNDAEQRFEKVAQLDLDAPVRLEGHPSHHTVAGVEYVYFGNPYLLVRVPATPDALQDPSRHEAFTCLEAGTRLGDHRVDRGADGALRYGWKAATQPTGPEEQAELLKAGLIRPEEALIQLQDVSTGEAVIAHRGSVYWNEFRRRWVMIATQTGGASSFLGEVWYAEADTPLGPWVYARKIVTHDRYTFYNPKQHPMFDQEGGRLIYFEGTYARTFSGNPDPTPRYDYNQLMYRLDLGDPRLVLPVPVYRLGDGGLGLIDAVGEAATLPPIAFFALDRPGEGSVPVYARPGPALSLTAPAADAQPLFHALPADIEEAPATTVLLREVMDPDTAPPCRVWRNLTTFILPRNG